MPSAKPHKVVTACGQLTRPQVPRVDGLEGFRGDVFHSAEWDHDYPLEGKRVGVVGSGVRRGTDAGVGENGLAVDLERSILALDVAELRWGAVIERDEKAARGQDRAAGDGERGR